jgi:hypothetical protein
MSDRVNPAGRVVSVLLADGWHRIVPGSFTISPLRFGAEADLGEPGFRFEEADAGSPYQPTVLIGPLHNIIAVRQITSAVPNFGNQDRVKASHNGHQAARGALLRVRAGT